MNIKRPLSSFRTALQRFTLQLHDTRKQPVDQPVDQPMGQPVNQPVGHSVDNPVDQPVIRRRTPAAISYLPSPHKESSHPPPSIDRDEELKLGTLVVGWLEDAASSLEFQGPDNKQNLEYLQSAFRAGNSSKICTLDGDSVDDVLSLMLKVGTHIIFQLLRC